MKEFNYTEVKEAEDLDAKFVERAVKVAQTIYNGTHILQINTGFGVPQPRAVACESDGRQSIKVFYWDGYKDEPFLNKNVTFPFEWIKMNDDQLQIIREEVCRKYDEIIEKAAKKAEQDRKREREKRDRIRKSEGFKQYKRLKRKFEEYEQ